jgi:hypothetical protein
VTYSPCSTGTSDSVSVSTRSDHETDRPLSGITNVRNILQHVQYKVGNKTIVKSEISFQQLQLYNFFY